MVVVVRWRAWRGVDREGDIFSNTPSVFQVYFLFFTDSMQRFPICTARYTVAQRPQWRTLWWRSRWSSGCNLSGWTLFTATRPKRMYKVIWLFHAMLNRNCTATDPFRNANPPLKSPLLFPSLPLLSIHCFFILAFRAGYEKEESRLPKAEDLQGAAKGLMRLQDVYSLRMDGLVNGYFPDGHGRDHRGYLQACCVHAPHRRWLLPGGEGEPLYIWNAIHSSKSKDFIFPQKAHSIVFFFLGQGGVGLNVTLWWISMQ